MNKTLRISILLTFFLMLFMPFYMYATHLRAGEITVEIIDCAAHKVKITITVFTNTKDTNVLFGGQEDWLDFGDNNRILIPEQPNVLRPDLGENIATASYTVEHIYGGDSKYLISYSEPNRNAGVLNMDGSVNTLFYIETLVSFDLNSYGCNNSPILLIPPIDRGCTGVAFFHNPGAYDPDKGDSLSYEMVIPFRAKNTTVVNYKAPNDPKFYTNYNAGNEQQNGAPTFAINPTDGTITWDAPGSVSIGEYNIAFIVREWKKIGGVWRSIGYVRRDMQILVEECKNERPDLEIPDELCVEAGTLVDETIFGTDPDGDPVKIEAFSEILNFAPPATYSPNPAVFQPTTPDKAKLQFKWQTDCSHVQEQPYNVVFKITDKSPTGSRLVAFKTWAIRVVGPKPVWQSATLNAATKSTDLKWNPYVCQNAQSMQVWRRVDELPFEPDNCETGMPENLGYTLITTVPIKDGNGTPITAYTDTGLSAGAKYCYRLVAVFPLPGGGESYVSQEVCVGPLLADDPMITHVTVDKTDVSNGQITIRWREPFEADPVQYPHPYTYDVFRAEGFTGDLNLTKITTTPVQDPDENDPTPIEIVDTGLDTEDKVYNYRIIAYDANNSEVGTSATASSVRLEASSQLKKIQLTWSASVPWSNVIAGQVHDIYRGNEGEDESTFTLIASVEPTEGGFTFVDEGPLEDRLYCYRVKTRGSYGNPAVHTAPLENFSQRICALPGDNVPPCKPTLFVQLRDCDHLDTEELCNPKTISNTIYWNRPSDDCARDIAGYRVYRSKTIDGIYIPLNVDVLIKDTFYIDSQVESFAYCYKLQQIDRSGNESELSDPACNDNCIYYELPNVFTPNGDVGDCNELFSAFSTNFRYEIPDETGDGIKDYRCGGVTDERKCARGVQKVVLVVYNRWGKEVYNYQSGTRENKSIYIDWDGRGSDGVELPSGIYYYMADVTFDTVQPDKVKTIKGWVHLLR